MDVLFLLSILINILASGYIILLRSNIDALEERIYDLYAHILRYEEREHGGNWDV